MATLKNEPRWTAGPPAMHDIIHGLRFYRDLSSAAQLNVLREEIGDYNEEVLERFSTMGFTRRLMKNGHAPLPESCQKNLDTFESNFITYIATHHCEETQANDSSRPSGSSKRSVHDATKRKVEELFEEIEPLLLTQEEVDWTKFLLQHEAKPAYLKHLDAIFTEEAPNYDAGIDFFEPVRACYAEFKKFFKKRGRKPRSDKGKPRGKRAETPAKDKPTKVLAVDSGKLSSVPTTRLRAAVKDVKGKNKAKGKTKAKTRAGLPGAVQAIKTKAAPKKKRKTRSDKGKKRGPRK